MSFHNSFFENAVKTKESASGLTLIECLVAIALMGLTTAIIAPVMVFSVATRVQSQRAEQALKVAQSEVEEIRLLTERGGDFSAALDAYPTPLATTGSIVSTAGPTTTAGAFGTSFQTAKEINIDDDAEAEFAVQVFRSEGQQPTGSPVPIAFKLGVRVYDIRAFKNNGGSALLTDAAALSFTNGEGQRGSRPLAVIYADIFQGDGDDSLCEYRQYLNSTATTPATMTGINCT